MHCNKLHELVPEVLPVTCLTQCKEGMHLWHNVLKCYYVLGDM